MKRNLIFFCDEKLNSLQVVYISSLKSINRLTNR